MKIVHCLFTMEIGGAQVLTVGLLNQMCIANDVVLVIINNKWSDELLTQVDKRVKIYYIKRVKGDRAILPVIRLNILLFKLKPDIIHCHEPNMAKIIKVRRPKLLQTVHDVGISTQYYNLYDELIAISDAVYSDVSSRWNKAIKRIYNGIPITEFKRRSNYILNNGKPIKLVQISRLVHEKKGQDILIQAMHIIVYEYGFCHFHLDIIGDGESFDFLAGLIKELGLTDNVKLLGEKSRTWIMCELCSYHILVQPSRYEGFGLTIIEGFAAGLPVLSSNIDGPKEIISDMSAGFLFESGDVNSCVAELFKIAALYSDGKVEQFLEETIPLIEVKYSMQECAGSYLTEYKTVVNKQMGAPAAQQPRNPVGISTK